MTITLTSEHEQLVAEALRTGAYGSADEVIGRALEILHSEDERLLRQRDSIQAKIEHAFAQFESGEFLSSEESRLDLQRRKEEWLAAQHSS
ncbi:MAG: type II toxin-antitoxin system ParD family antitoxin [Bryobacteraceae bacterium]